MYVRTSTYYEHIATSNLPRGYSSNTIPAAPNTGATSTSFITYVYERQSQTPSVSDDGVHEYTRSYVQTQTVTSSHSTSFTIIFR